MLKKVIVGLLAISIVLAAGCDNAAKSGTLIGAGGGALAGQAIGGNTEGTLIGAGVGALAGYIVGNEMDKSETKKKQNYSSAPAPAAASNPTYSTPSSGANTVTVWINNTNGSQTAVKLTQNGDGSYTGPKGERYTTMPTEQQLKSVYGI